MCDFTIQPVETNVETTGCGRETEVKQLEITQPDVEISLHLDRANVQVNR